MLRHSLVFTLFTSVALTTCLRAEKVDMTPQQLRETATHVITGQVTAIYTRTETAGDWRYTRHLAEIQVDTCEKGDGIKKGDLVYARYWKREWIGKGQMPPSTIGHRALPSDGESLRVYLARNAYDGFYSDNKDGGFNVIGANGFEKLKPENTLVNEERGAARIKLADLKDGEYIFAITHKDDKPAKEEKARRLRIFDDGKRVSLLPDKVSGTLDEGKDQQRSYFLEEGLFAGGRLTLKETEIGVTATYTIFGSGVPIAASYKGQISKGEVNR